MQRPASEDVKEGKWIVVEFTFTPFPIGAPHLGKVLARALLTIVESGLDFHIGPMSTVIEGDPIEVFQLIEKCKEIILSNSHPAVLRLQTVVKTDIFPGMQKGEIRRRMKWIERSIRVKPVSHR